jgi:gamma-glutamylcyclotransferase (GGCT)/AIG2-like uncharacterized protein YtfP
MSHSEGAMAAMLASQSSKISRGIYQGKMYRVCRPDGSLVYPAVVPSDDESDRVIGELYSLSDPSILDHLDDYESCGPNSPTPHEYHRQLVDIELPTKASVKAYIYLYALSTADLTAIPEGSFVDQIEEEQINLPHQ